MNDFLTGGGSKKLKRSKSPSSHKKDSLEKMNKDNLLKLARKHGMRLTRREGGYYSKKELVGKLKRKM